MIGMEMPCGSCNSNCVDCDYYRLKMKESKYGWRDLRKNPDDLPEKEGVYFVATQEYPNALEKYEIGHYEPAYGYGWLDWFHDKIVAWREIDLFEGDLNE